jgi:hypothetical protein
MDYKEKYNKLVEAVKVLQEANPSDDGIQNWVIDNVPELRESEDERIRKAISIYLDWLDGRKDCAPRGEYSIRDMVAWLEKQGQVKESEISQPIKETSKENNNSLTNKAWSEIQNGIILDGVVYELTTGFPDNKLSLCGNCELNEKCIDFDGSLCYFFADNYRKVFRKVKMERKL